MYFTILCLICSDGIARVFTTEPTRMALPEEIAVSLKYIEDLSKIHRRLVELVLPPYSRLFSPRLMSTGIH